MSETKEDDVLIPSSFGLITRSELIRKSEEKSHELQRQDEQEEEEILVPNPKRFVLFPIKYPEIWDMYLKHEGSFWTAAELDLSGDLKDWENLHPDEQRFIKLVLGFFAAADGIVMENLAVRFMNEVQVPEARSFYSFQLAMENIHSHTYSLLIDTYIKSDTEKQELLDAVDTYPSIAAKANWALQWLNNGECPFAQRLVAFACVEGIFFSASFCSIFWLKKRNLMPGLTFSNELVSRDEGLHCDFACLLYKMLRYKCSETVIHEIVRGAVAVECEFVRGALPVALIGMNADLMIQYVQFVANRLLQALGYNKLWNVQNPFDWMEMISLDGKTNFFERRVADYKRKVKQERSDWNWELDGDF